MPSWRPRVPYSDLIYKEPIDYTSGDPVLGTYTPPDSGAAGGSFNVDTTPTPVIPNTGVGAVDLRAMIMNDPLFRQQQADMSAQGIADASQRAAAIKRQLIQYGLVPDFAAAAKNMGLSSTALGFVNSDVDQMTRDLAAKNTREGLSISAKIAKANEDNIRAIRNTLAARGMYQSGELGHGLGENAQQYKQATTEAEQQTLGGIEQAAAMYSQAERERQRQLAEYMMAAGQRQLALIGDAGGDSSTGGTTGTTTGISNTTNPGPGQVGWDPTTHTPIAGQGLSAGTYTVNGIKWTYDPTRGWTRLSDVAASPSVGSGTTSPLLRYV